MNKPWLLIVASAFTIGALFGLVASIVFSAGAAVSVALAGQRWIAVALIALGASLLGVVRIASTTQADVEPAVLTSVHAEVVVASQPQIGPSGPRAVVEVERIGTDEDGWSDASGRVLVFFRETAPNGIGHGDRLQLVWSVTPISKFDPGFRGFVEAADAGAGAWVFHTSVIERGDSSANVFVRLRDTVTSRIESAVDGDAGALVAGFVTGDDSGLSEQTRDAFDRTNTSHITAVSGSNVAVLLSMWLALVPSRRMQRSVIALGAALLLIWAYVVLVGMGPGAVRAGLFATLMLPAARLGRRADPLTSLMAASAAMLLVEPEYAQNVGFWLSMAASAAMVTSLSFRQHGSALDVIRSGVIALVAAQVATFPITFWVFDGWSPGSMVANLIIGPLVSFVFPFAFFTAIAVTLVPWVGDLLGWIPELGAGTIIAIVEGMAGEFPMLRSGTSTPTAISLLAAMCLVVIATISVDARRWIRRVAHRREGWVPYVPAALLGASAGVWLTVMMVALVR